MKTSSIFKILERLSTATLSSLLSAAVGFITWKNPKNNILTESFSVSGSLFAGALSVVALITSFVLAISSAYNAYRTVTSPIVSIS